MTEIPKNLLLVGLCLVLPIGSAQSAVLVQESFDYAGDANIGGLNGGTGFSGAWSGTNTAGSNSYTVEDGISFPGVASSGGSAGRVSRDGRHVITRTVTGAAQSAFTGDNTTVYFSILMDPRSSDISGNSPFENNTRGTFVFGSSALSDASGATPGIFGSASSGIGVAFNGANGGTVNNTTFENSNLVGVSYDGATAATIIGGTGALGDVVSMVVGEITWSANGSDDVINLYNVTDPSAGLPASAFATINVDLDQSTFNTISYAEGQASQIDEIIFGEELADVGVGLVPEPSSALLLSLSSLALLRRRRS
jgi:hypothetical protein